MSGKLLGVGPIRGFKRCECLITENVEGIGLRTGFISGTRSMFIFSWNGLLEEGREECDEERRVFEGRNREVDKSEVVVSDGGGSCSVKVWEGEEIEDVWDRRCGGGESGGGRGGTLVK